MDSYKREGVLMMSRIRSSMVVLAVFAAVLLTGNSTAGAAVSSCSASIVGGEVVVEINDSGTGKELGLDIDDSSVNYRGLMVPKGTPQAIVDRLSTIALKMFEDDTVVSRMKEGGSPLRVMDRDAVLSMWTERQAYLAQLLRGL